jgi:hypothetical protein
VGAWGAGRLSDLWIEVVKKTPTGDFHVLVDTADRIARSSAARSVADVEAHARRLLQSFVAVVDGWREAKRKAPQKSVEAFLRNFAACEEVIDGERDPTRHPAPETKREPEQREYEDLEEIMRRTTGTAP